MADDIPSEGLDSAEKAFAAAAEASVVKEAPVIAAPEPAPAPEVTSVAEAPAPAPAPAPVAEPVPAPKATKPVPAPKVAVAKKPAVKPAAPAVAKAAPAPVAPTPVPAPVAAKPVAKLAPKLVKPKKVKPTKKPVAVAKPVAKPAPIKPVAVKKPAAPAVAAKAASTPITQLKDTIMTTKKTATDFTAKAKAAFADVSTKAKEVYADVSTKTKDAYAKGTAAVTEATEFTKGNVEAVVESGKILADGFKGMGTDYVAEGKKAFETATADVKELTAVKSPTEFFQLQAKILRRNFDSAVALGSKNTEATVKLAGDAFAPISTRVSLAIEKVKAAA